jgi:phosphoglycerate dehydrogenase-like enzyme
LTPLPAAEAMPPSAEKPPPDNAADCGGEQVDVWWQYPTAAEPERRPSRRPFHELPNVLITPHSSSSSDATADRRWSVVAANLDRYARGEKLENIVLQT